MIGILKLEPEIQMALNFIKNQFELDQRKWEKKVAAKQKWPMGRRVANQKVQVQLIL